MFYSASTTQTVNLSSLGLYQHVSVTEALSFIAISTGLGNEFFFFFDSLFEDEIRNELSELLTNKLIGIFLLVS